ncbi:cytochrome P450 2B1-like [Saccoglossus kowalevskii]|uniref:Cytochrome P450 2U1-like n=1 Tax=Saccoglossus kowalevskii TaxID=10224 RepID=A0ABM0N0Q8_SACKO|nr:PREDICTED: cytochrome P450 2U1-like [Saccoglossus kowalevskii]
MSVLADSLYALWSQCDLQTVILATTIFLFTYWALQLLLANHRNLPPGPRGFPLIGNVLDLVNPTPFRNLRDMASQYGDVLSLHLGQQLVVVLNGYQSIHEALVGKADDFADRPHIPPMKTGTLNSGIIMANGKVWKFKRRVILSSLRTFGMGKASMEKRIQEEVLHLLDVFDEMSVDSSTFNPLSHTTNSIYNVICSITLGERFDYTDHRFVDIISSLNSILDLSHVYFGFMYFFPGSYKILELLLRGHHARDHRKIYDVLEPFIEQHETTYDSQNMRDLIDVFLKATREWESRHFSESFGRKGLPFKYFYIYALILDTFVAGTETTATTLTWGWLLMLKNLDTQTQIQAELDNVVGRGRLPEMSDKPNLPYTEAAVNEVLRMSSTAPLSVPRWTTTDTCVLGYDIPKNTMVWPNLWSVLYDPTLWPNPDRFDPGRFLDSDGNFYRPDAFIPFGSGSRVCLGEQLAKMELFLVFSSVLHQFRLEVDNEFPLPLLEGTMHITLQPPKYKMRVIRRVQVNEQDE